MFNEFDQAELTILDQCLQSGKNDVFICADHTSVSPDWRKTLVSRSADSSQNIQAVGHVWETTYKNTLSRLLPSVSPQMDNNFFQWAKRIGYAYWPTNISYPQGLLGQFELLGNVLSRCLIEADEAAASTARQIVP